MICRGNYADRIGAGAHVYLAAEVLELTGSTARADVKTSINQRYLQLTVHND
uniref:Lipoprotein n=2 Tax=Heterorhabditis bacteriophora TaxID=37862 RepID=A0A1I7WIG8_HETBA